MGDRKESGGDERMENSVIHCLLSRMCAATAESCDCDPLGKPGDILFSPPPPCFCSPLSLPLGLPYLPFIFRSLEMGSHIFQACLCVAKGDCELLILLPLLPECGDFSPVLLDQFYAVLETEPETSSMLGNNCIKSAASLALLS